jgi:hypothetical protein
MPRARLPDPERFCLYCAKRLVRLRAERVGRFVKRHYCSHRCAGMAKSRQHWRGTLANTPIGFWNALDAIDEDIVR